MLTKEELPACPVATTVQLIGSKWKLLIIRNLRERPWRFNELRRLVPEATPKMLTQQLRELEGDGLIARKVYAVVPPKVEYSLTPRGESLFPILQAMYAWGSKLLEGEGICPECSMKPVEAEHCCCHDKNK